MTAIHLSHISKSFGSTSVLKDVSFSVESGEKIAILGESGAGKTTLLRIISGLEKDYEGQLLFDGKDMRDVLPSERNLGMIFQDGALFEHMTVRNNISYGWKGDVTKTAEMLGISDLLDRYPASLSAGQKQRAGIARALVRNPSVLLLDEPFSSLDERLKEDLQKEVKELCKEKGITMILVTHDQKEMMVMAEKAVILKDGSVLAFDSPASLYDHPQNLETALFLGDPKINVVEKEDGFTAIRPHDLHLVKEKTDDACTVLETFRKQERTYAVVEWNGNRLTCMMDDMSGRYLSFDRKNVLHFDLHGNRLL